MYQIVIAFDTSVESGLILGCRTVSLDFGVTFLSDCSSRERKQFTLAPKMVYTLATASAMGRQTKVAYLG